MKRSITDIHMHIIPGVDDGAIDFKMSLEMIEEAYKQGVRNIFCTSHNVYEKEDIERYKSKFFMLKKMSESLYHDLNLFMGCELLCAGEYMEDILYGLEIGVFLPLGGSEFVLTELYSDATPDEAKAIVNVMIAAGWKPILAHTERYPALFEGQTLQKLIALGAMIQVNLYSLEEEINESVKERARHLVNNRLAHFVGSDSHRTNYRPPEYETGIRYLEEHCEKDYCKRICSVNAERLLIGSVKKQI